jgi:hypothetical protein
VKLVHKLVAFIKLYNEDYIISSDCYNYIATTEATKVDEMGIVKTINELITNL